MNFDDYQKLSDRTADFSGRPGDYPLMYCSMGLAGETGELIEKIKKVVRNDNGELSAEKRELIKLEIGDVLWYLSQIARITDISFQDAAEANVKKLADRRERGVIRSEGDTR